jgi:hypothetical protein
VAHGDAARGIVLDAKGLTLGQWLEDVVKPSQAHRTYATHHLQAEEFRQTGDVKLL